MDAKQFLKEKGISNNDFMDSGVADLIETLLTEYQALQLQQGGVSGSYSKEELISAAKYGYEFHKTTSFPKQTFEQCCKNNFLQHLSMYNIVNNGRNITKCVVCGKRYHNPNNDSDTCYECREPHCK